MTALDVIVEDPRWDGVDLPHLAARAVTTSLQHLGFDPQVWEVVLLAADDARLRALNADFRDKDAPTNVLSWPSQDRAAPGDGDAPERPAGPETELGDIALAYETCAREAEASDTPFADHICHLVVHGLLHLLGYDHERDADAALMEQIEVEILGKLGIGDPYCVE